MSSSSDWCTIESDPGVFTYLIESFGVSGVEIEELWSLDDDSLQHLCQGSKVFGLIFLFKWQASAEDNRPTLGEDEIMQHDLFFAKQMVTNACATQAILSVLLNAPSAEEEQNGDHMQLGPILSSFKSFTSSFPPDLKGMAIGGSEDIRTAHNNFARNDPFLAEGGSRKNPKSEDDSNLFHFIAYIPKNGQVYELDGLKSGPIVVGSYSNNTASEESQDAAWLNVARSAIQERIEKFSSSEIKFNLMAVIRDRRIDLQNNLQNLQLGGEEREEKVVHLQTQLAALEEKRSMWKRENERRSHNYIPFCVELLKALARSGKLPQITQEANTRLLDTKKKRKYTEASKE